jgi:S1 RNA binding domain protein
MVHISEVANTYVSEIKDHIAEGQTVKVKVLSLGEGGKISLSIKKAQPAPEKKQYNKSDRKKDGAKRGFGDRNHGAQQGSQRRSRSYERPEPQDFAKNPPPVYDVRTASGDSDFEDMLSKFKATSEERFSDNKRFMESSKRRSTTRRR